MREDDAVASDVHKRYLFMTEYHFHKGASNKEKRITRVNNKGNKNRE